MYKRKVWFITGASHGVGLSLVKQLLVRGDQVAAATRSPEYLSEQVHGAVPTALMRNFLALQVDLTDESAIEHSIALAHQNFGRIDVVVNNAGYSLPGSMEELSPAQIDQCFAIHSTAPLMVMYKALPYFRQQRSGYILNVSSLAACATAADNSLYAAAKYATMGLSDLLRAEESTFNIFVTVLAPASFQSRLYAREYDMWDNDTIRDAGHAATSLIHLAELSAPPPILLIGDINITTNQKQADNAVQFTR